MAIARVTYVGTLKKKKPCIVSFNLTLTTLVVLRPLGTKVYLIFGISWLSIHPITKLGTWNHSNILLVIYMTREQEILKSNYSIPREDCLSLLEVVLWEPRTQQVYNHSGFWSPLWAPLSVPCRPFLSSGSFDSTWWSIRVFPFRKRKVLSCQCTHLFLLSYLGLSLLSSTFWKNPDSRMELPSMSFASATCLRFWSPFFSLVRASALPLVTCLTPSTQLRKYISIHLRMNKESSLMLPQYTKLSWAYYDHTSVILFGVINLPIFYTKFWVS